MNAALLAGAGLGLGLWLVVLGLRRPGRDRGGAG